eukprot:358746-Chlamydomonas_euryale.AAC.1
MGGMRCGRGREAEGGRHAWQRHARSRSPVCVTDISHVTLTIAHHHTEHIHCVHSKSPPDKRCADLRMCRHVGQWRAVLCKAGRNRGAVLCKAGRNRGAVLCKAGRDRGAVLCKAGRNRGADACGDAAVTRSGPEGQQVWSGRLDGGSVRRSWCARPLTPH